jgi:fructosamine-3-kinase
VPISAHSLAQAANGRAVERATSAHVGRPWTAVRFQDLDDRASHPCGIFHGEPVSVFVKLGASGESEQFAAELSGHRLLARRAAVGTPTPVGAGRLEVEGGCLLLLEAIPEVPAADRSAEQWRSIGRGLAALHQVRDATFGLDQFDGFFGPFRQDNRPVDSNRWADFYARRRLVPRLRSAVDSGRLAAGVAAAVEGLIGRLPALSGPDPEPSLLHGDAQQNNFLTGVSGPVIIDAAPHFGHPELDLALLDYFAPVPADVWDGYRDVAPIAPDFPELWRLFAYLAVVTIDAGSPVRREFLDRLAAALASDR